MSCAGVDVKVEDGIKIIFTKTKMLKGGKVKETITELHCEIVNIKSSTKTRKATAKENGQSDCL